MHGHLPDPLQRQPGLAPRRHPAYEISGDLGVTNPDKIAHDFIELLVGIQNQRDRLLGIQQPACPDWEYRIAADVECPP